MTTLVAVAAYGKQALALEPVQSTMLLVRQLMVASREFRDRSQYFAPHHATRNDMGMWMQEDLVSTFSPICLSQYLN